MVYDVKEKEMSKTMLYNHFDRRAITILSTTPAISVMKEGRVILIDPTVIIFRAASSMDADIIVLNNTKQKNTYLNRCQSELLINLLGLSEPIGKFELHFRIYHIRYR